MAKNEKREIELGTFTESVRFEMKIVSSEDDEKVFQQVKEAFEEKQPELFSMILDYFRKHMDLEHVLTEEQAQEFEEPDITINKAGVYKSNCDFKIDGEYRTFIYFYVGVEFSNIPIVGWSGEFHPGTWNDPPEYPECETEVAIPTIEHWHTDNELVIGIKNLFNKFPIYHIQTTGPYFEESSTYTY